MKAMSQPQNPQVRIVQGPDYRDGYANSVQVRVSLWDFFLQFGTLGQQTTDSAEINAFQGIYLSPQQTKALHHVLTENLAQYETAFGKIELDPKAAARQGSVQ